MRVVVQCSSGGDITIVADNTAPKPPRKGDDGTFLTTKPTGSGIGLQSIRYVAQQYNGMANFEWHDGMFYASVFLNVAAA